MAKNFKRPVYNAVGLLPEAQLDILNMACECGSVMSNQLDTLTPDEQALVDYGFLAVKNDRDWLRLHITSAGKKAAPGVKAAESRWETFGRIAPSIALCIQDNTIETLRETKTVGQELGAFTFYPITCLLIDCGQINSAIDTYTESYPDEVAALKRVDAPDKLNCPVTDDSTNELM
jgi:hypothetical protein